MRRLLLFSRHYVYVCVLQTYVQLSRFSCTSAWGGCVLPANGLVTRISLRVIEKNTYWTAGSWDVGAANQGMRRITVRVNEKHSRNPDQ